MAKDKKPKNEEPHIGKRKRHPFEASPVPVKEPEPETVAEQ